MRLYYDARGRRRGTSLSGGEAALGCLVRGVLIWTFLAWPVILAAGVSGKIALWGWLAEVGWLVLLSVIAVVAAGVKERKS